MSYLELLRPRHWIKNLLIFLPLVTAYKLLDPASLLQVSVGTVVFCMLSSAVYIFNDMHDIESDRAHPKKSKRPLASGAVSFAAAKAMIGVLLTIIVFLSVLVLKLNLDAWIVLITYLLLNVSYCLFLKHIAIADIFALASGYPLRVYFCSAITGIYISEWLFLTLIAGALSIAVGKRRGEMIKHGNDGETRRVLKQYTRGFLDKYMYMCEGISIVFYSLWSIENVTGLSSHHMVFTVPLVILIFMRYNLLLEGDTDGDPINLLMEDRPLLMICGVFTIVFIVLLYLSL